MWKKIKFTSNFLYKVMVWGSRQNKKQQESKEEKCESFQGKEFWEINKKKCKRKTPEKMYPEKL